MNIECGWRLYTAGFSIQAGGKGNATGVVMLVRAPNEKARWHDMPEEMKEDENGPPLYVVGHGITLEVAIVNANLAASHAKPIPDTTPRR